MDAEGTDGTSAYRMQLFVERSAERCFCDVAVTSRERCDCCRRPRCAEHRIRGLCSRCGTAIGRERRGLRREAVKIGGAVGAVVTVPLMFVIYGAALVGLATAAVVGIGVYRWLLARVVRRLRPYLSTSVGELSPAQSEDAWFPDAPPPEYGGG